MALYQKFNVLDNERIDRSDVQLIESFGCADWEQYFKYFNNSTSLILKGFRVFQDSGLLNSLPTASPVYIETSNSAIIHTSGGSCKAYVGQTANQSTEITLTANATNYIELDLTTSTGSPADKAFWDPTADEEFTQNVDTAINIDASVTVNTSGFSGGTKVSIAEIIVDAGGNITALYDRRELFFRLAAAQPYDGDKNFSFTTGRYEALHTVTLTGSEGSYVHSQTTASTSWAITHNLAVQYVHVIVYDTDDNVIIPDNIAATSANVSTITFSTATAGKAVIVCAPSANRFSYTNGAAATSWVVSHNLGTQYVNVTVYDTSDNVIIPNSIVATDANTTTIGFSVATDGYAIITEEGGGGASFLYTNGAAATTWNIAHNLNSQYVIPTIYDTSDNVLIPDSITATDDDNMVVTFSVATDGVAKLGSGTGGSYTAGETVEGLTSGNLATVVAGGTGNITIHNKNGEFTVGEALFGQTSGANKNISTIKEDFNAGDKGNALLKNDLDALKTEIYRIKFGSATRKFWYQDAETNLGAIDTLIDNVPSTRGYITNDGTTLTINDGGNIASVVLNSIGNITVNFTTNYTDTFYQLAITPDEDPNGVTCSVTDRSLDSVTLQFRNAGSSPSALNVNFSVLIVGDLVS